MIPQNCVLYLEQCDKKKEKDEEHLLPKLLSVVTVVIVLSGFLVCVCVCVCACTCMCLPFVAHSPIQICGRGTEDICFKLVRS